MYGNLPNNYSGSIATTAAGYECQNWSSNDSDIPNVVSTKGGHNYCRSFSAESLGAWCYTTEPTIIWQYCSCTVQTSGKFKL